MTVRGQLPTCSLLSATSPSLACPEAVSSTLLLSMS